MVVDVCLKWSELEILILVVKGKGSCYTILAITATSKGIYFMFSCFRMFLYLFPCYGQGGCHSSRQQGFKFENTLCTA